MVLTIKGTTVTPLCQIVGVEERQKGGSKVQVTAIQKMPMYVGEEGHKQVVKIPIFTANGIRGKLRREATSLIINKAIEKGLPLGKNALSIGKSFHAMNAGSSVTYSNPKFEQEDAIREANPVISLFGTSLAISGKLNVSPLIPKRLNTETGELEVCVRSDENGRYYSDIISLVTKYKKDDVQNKSVFAAPLGKKFHIEWGELVEEAKADKKKANLDAGHVLSNEEINVGVDLYGSIIESAPLTDIERGLLITSIINFSKKQLGALNSTSRGKVDYFIKIDDGVIRSKWDEYGAIAEVSVELGEEANACVDTFNEWLENIGEENVQIELMLSELEKKD